MGLLWFRRSRREEPKRGTAPAPSSIPPAEPSSPRVPPRIGGLLLLNLLPSDGAEQIERAPALGPRETIVTALRTLAPGLEFDDVGRGVLKRGQSRLTIDIGRDTPVAAAVASAEGDEGLEGLRTVVRSQGWRIYAPRAGVFIDPDALDRFADTGVTSGPP